MSRALHLRCNSGGGSCPRHFSSVDQQLHARRHRNLHVKVGACVCIPSSVRTWHCKLAVHVDSEPSIGPGVFNVAPSLAAPPQLAYCWRTAQRMDCRLEQMRLARQKIDLVSCDNRNRNMCNSELGDCRRRTEVVISAVQLEWRLYLSSEDGL